MVQEKEEQGRMVIDNPSIGIVWGTPDGHLTDANNAFCNLVGYSKEELANAHFNKFTHPEDIPYALSMYLKLLNGTVNDYQIEKRYLIKGNSLMWVKVNVSAIRNSKGDIVSILGIVQDISERKKAEQLLLKSETNLRFVLSNSDSAFVLLDTDGRVVMTNRVADQWAVFEMDRNLQPGELFTDILPDSYHEKGVAAVQAALAGLSYSYEDRYKKRDGNIGWYHVRLDSIKDEKGQVTGLCISVNDTTRYRSAQAEIKAMNDSLEKKVKERTAELENANKELEAFTYSVSHDLMAPLRIIDGFSQVLLDDYRNKLDEDGLQTLQVIKRNATRMGELVNDLLNLARLGRANLVKRNVNMNDVVASVIDEMRFSTNKLEAKIKLQDLKPADCDHVLIKQVWANLLSNAIKYSKYREAPLIEIGCLEQKGQTVYFIKDNGVGFDLQYAGKLFGVFQRLHKPTEFPGTGVGLAIVHRIITRHGGKVWADAKIDDGAVFYFTLP